MKLTIEYHAGNPNLCRIPELKIRAMPECEGGGWYIPREQAEAIVRAMQESIHCPTYKGNGVNNNQPDGCSDCNGTGLDRSLEVAASTLSNGDRK